MTFFMQFSLNKKISDKTSQNKDLSQCDIAISQYRKSGDPKRYFVLLGKRNKPAKDRQLSLAMIGWSKVQFMTWHTSPR